ncbi:MAG TPA: hypothetical protein VK445_11390, partial [Dissulfurispiraceae bacterium]|nr:hypothetical protein [Dissulfurispiraceae bacterium]
MKRLKTCSASQYVFRGRIWVDGPEGTYLGYGRVVLLGRIREYGSITRAAKSMEMSYRHAWELVDSMNRQAPAPLVQLLVGGQGGGGAFLTDEGERAIAMFWSYYDAFQLFVVEEQIRNTRIPHPSPGMPAVDCDASLRSAVSGCRPHRKMFRRV